MRRRPLAVLAPLAALFLLLAPAAPSRADGPRTLPELKALLAEKNQTLAKTAESLAAVPAAADHKEKTAALLASLASDLETHELLARSSGVPDDGKAAAAKAALQKAAGLQAAFWTERAAAPAKPAAGHPFVAELKRARDALSAFLGLAAPGTAAYGGAPARAESAGDHSAAGGRVQRGRRVLGCAGVFDGGSCGSATAGGTAGGAFGDAAGRDGAGSNAAPSDGGRRTATASGSSDRSRPAAVRAVAGDGTLGQSPLSGGRVSIDRGVVPPVTSASHLTAGNPAGASAAPAVKPAPPLSAESRSCVAAVNGNDPGNPEHPTLAGMCGNHPTIAPLLAGLLDSVKEQFGTVSGILMNILFLLLGLLMAVATGGVALILKLLALIGASAAIFFMIRSLISAAGVYRSAKDGSPEKAAALRTMGQVGGNIMIMVTMALVGFGIGKTKPGAAAIKSMEGGMAAALNKVGGTGLMNSLNSRIPAPMVAALEKVFGKAPEPAAAGKPRPAAPARPRELLPEALENPRLAAVAGKAGLVSRVTASIKSEVRAQVAQDMRAIVREALGPKPDAAKITGRQFNILLKKLTTYAENVEGGGIAVNKRWGLFKGVYPKGPGRIDYKGFGLIRNEAAEVTGAQLHELTHLVHTVQMRATVMASGVSKAEGTKFLAFMEDGLNYMNLEYYATTVGKPVAGGTAAGRFHGLVTNLIESIENSMASGKVALPLGVPIEKGYAYWASKLVPALLGKSPAELIMVRMPIGVFIGYYAANTDIGFVLEGASVDPKKLQAMGVPPNTRGLRDVLNAAVVAQMGGDPKAAQVASLGGGEARR